MNEKALKKIATLWMYCFANVCDTIGGTLRATFGTVGETIEGKVEEPEWLKEISQVRDE